jgi:hypothetical protein
MKAPFAFVAGCAALLVFPVVVAPAQGASPAETLFAAANRERASRQLAPLKWSASLAAAAEQHAQRMAAENTLSHQFPGEPSPADRATEAGARFTAFAENVAEGPGAESIHRQWMNSPPHRANLLDPNLDSMGIAVAPRNGVLFAVEDFSRAAGTLSIEDQETIVKEKLQARGLRLLNYTEEARKSCELDNGYAGGNPGSHAPSFVLHYATSDLQTLPDKLVQRIETSRYHSAAVGACASNGKSELSGYRLAVLLYE